MRTRRPSLVASLATVAVAALPAWLCLSCIIAEPPADLPKLPTFRPTILHGSVAPPSGRLLASFPDKFVIPVELVDPTATFQWRAFIDYNPLTGDGIVDTGTSFYDRGGTDGGVRVLEVALPAPDLSRCHVVEFLVANGFRGDIEGRQAHTPDGTGGDSVTWFYVPAGDPGACSTPDASSPALDSGGDGASDAGVQ